MRSPVIVNALLAGVVALAFGAPAAAKTTACPGGRFMLSHTALIAGASAPANDVVEISGSKISIGSGCPAAHVSLKGKKKFTLVSARWKSCTGLKGPASLKGRIPTPACDTLIARFTTKKAKTKVQNFSAKRVPIFSSPSMLTVGPAGGTFTNPDGTSVTVPAGAYAPGQTAHVGVVAVGKADVFALEQAVGLVPPSGFGLLEALQVIIPPSDPDPSLSLTASMPDDGMSHPGLLIHTLIEPTSVAGEVDPRAAHLVFDGEVTQGDGRFSMQISPQNVQGSPGRGCVVNIPPTVPTCFIDGVVRDSNGSPVPNAIVTVSNLSLVARTNAAGFYRSVVAAGSFTATATAPIGTGTSAGFNCDPNTMPRIPGVDVTINVTANPAVPMVMITDPASDKTVNQTAIMISGSVTPDTITQVTIVTQTGDFADGFSQTVPVSGGLFTATVILSTGRENTIIVMATSGGLTGSARRVITVTGSSGEDLRFTLTWDMPGDVDLYVRTPGPNGIADTADGRTIYYENPTADNGVHDVDNTVGFGPENTVFALGMAAPGTYAFAAQYYAGTGTPTATVSVFVKGRLVGTFPQVLTAPDSNTGLNGLTLASPNSVFVAGTVSFPGGAIGAPVPQSTFLGDSGG